MTILVGQTRLREAVAAHVSRLSGVTHTAGNVIVSAGNHELASVSDLAAAVAEWKKEGRSAIPLSVRRNGQMLGFVPIKIDG